MPSDTDASARMTALRAGTASLLDVACAIMSSNLAGKLRRSAAVGTAGRGRGVLGVAFGVGVLVWPEVSLAVMVVGLAGYALLDGAICLLGLLTGPRTWRLVAEGIAGVAVGVAAPAWPDLSRLGLLYALAIWVVVMGALRLCAAIDFGDRVTVRWVAAILALLAITAGCTVLIDPGQGRLGLMVNIAVFPVLNGLALIAGRRAD
jgi:uncharacterized membrane protein HdeD (DUF308 family)